MGNEKMSITIARFEELVKKEAEHEVMVKMLNNSKFLTEEEVKNFLKIFDTSRKE